MAFKPPFPRGPVVPVLAPFAFRRLNLAAADNLQPLAILPSLAAAEPHLGASDLQLDRGSPRPRPSDLPRRKFFLLLSRWQNR